MAYISLQHVGKRYQMGEITITAVDDISFEIEKGQFAVIVGPSGAGKTTVLNILGGMDACDSGAIRVDGQEISAWSPKELARQLAAMGITLCPEPTVDVVRWRRRLFMFTHQKNKQRHLARHTGQAGAGICPQQRRP